MDVRVAGIVKRFAESTALRDVSLDVRPGELMALLGPSGSGKTTLLRVIAGLDIPESGTVAFGGRDATRLSVQHRRVGFVFQHYALFRHMSVADNVAYGLRARPRAQRPAETEIRRRVGELLDLVQLPGIAARFPMQLSGGQRQRVALARALATEPQVLLLDEPFGALDAKVRKELRRWLRDIHERSGNTTIFVTHDQDEALELADRVAILNNGRIEQVGTPDEVFDHPASAFVMSFIGETSRIPVEIKDGRVWHADFVIDVAATREDGPAALYVRPWDLAVRAASSGGLPGTVRMVRRVGVAKRLEVGLKTVGTSIEIDVAASTTLAPGDAVSVLVQQGRIFSE